MWHRICLFISLFGILITLSGFTSQIPYSGPGLIILFLNGVGFIVIAKLSEKLLR